MSQAQEIFDLWHQKSGHLHSEPFAQGVLYQLRRKLGEDSGRFPFDPGTVEYDAWDSGLSKGWDLWQRSKPRQAQLA